ncbi:MAG: lipopolysaccharide core heptose(II) kinase RfaY [Cetobacterium sp.]|uniref:lipopolysaccharide core heptose(II) kinase RfaY n=1 Tax=Cetobacterium sp. TaxID=2071632 RepID=UPI003F32A915
MERIYYESSLGKKVMYALKNKNYSIIQVLKEDNRSKVLLIEIEKKLYVYKVPIEKNSRKWQQFISLFRGGESQREFKNLKKIAEIGLKAPLPVLYWEKRILGMVVDSYLVSTYIEGNPGEKEDVEKIGKFLEEIHSKGFLHGDSQLPNFMVQGNEEIYLIDAKLQKNIYGPFGRVYEFIYLEESYHDELNIYDKTTIYYKIAKLFNGYLHWYGSFRKKIKKIFKRKDK